MCILFFFFFSIYKSMQHSTYVHPTHFLVSMAPLYILLSLVFFSPHTPLCCATDDTLAVAQALSVGDKLVSRNGKFALGFFQFQPTTSKSSDNTTSPNWYLGIWFNKIPVLTTVWVANRENPITATDINQTKLEITADGNLAILNHENESTVWSTSIVNSRTEAASRNTSTTVLVILNDGNLVMMKNSSNVVLWQSFDYPVDVLLPGAKFGWNKVSGLNRLGISRKSRIDPGFGPYTIALDTKGTKGVVLGRLNPPVVYWSWSSDKSLMLIPILKSLLDMDPRTKGLIIPIYVNNETEEYYMYNSTDESSSSFVSLDISGQVKINVWSQANQSWQVIYSQPADSCTPYATCGPFTVCNGNSPQFCGCMESFSRKSPRDWDLDDRTGGCIRNSPLDCTGKGNTTSSTDMFHSISRVTLPYNPQSVDDATTQSKCQEACLSDCSCTAYAYENSRCSIWHGELLSVNENDGTDNTSEDVLYLRLAAKDLPRFMKNKAKPLVGVVTAVSIAGFGLLMIILLLIVWRKKIKCCSGPLPLPGSQGSSGLIAFRYADLGQATRKFSEKLGGGGFGSVFKGVLSDLTAIAVKRLDGARQGEKQFRAEVGSLGLIQHINLVKLIGFCCEGDNRLLVYEHMSNGSLDVHLFQSSANVLNWNTRYQIVVGVARGLSYLHQSCRECIIHCDIKPENILLDESFVPKIADFGLAAVVGRDFSRVLTTFRGTIGYLAPEWISGVAVTPKVDVYSFGMVLLEIISGCRNSPNSEISNNSCVTYFPVQAISKLHEGDVQTLVDPRLNGDFNLEEVERVCRVACWCIQENDIDRPTMGEVVRVLDGVQELDLPPMPRLLAAMTQCSRVAST